MTRTLKRALLCIGLCLGACASEPDHFYTLNILPKEAAAARTLPLIHVVLKVDLPALVDRPEMVVNASDNSVKILDHQRWAPPLSDQLLQTLARDLERRRSDVLVADRAFDQKDNDPVTIRVEIVSLSVDSVGNVLLEAHWRIVDTKAAVDDIGSDVFNSQVKRSGFDGIAMGYSEVMSALAGKLSTQIRGR